ncbi:MAG: ribosome-binding factor A [Candidatus Zambryskibacteria bacterium]|nr:ribosome-binding factor A [Candidatus Zambryskibacteria bacterium]
MHQPVRYKDEKTSSLLKKFAAEYFESEASNQSLITITKVEVFERGRKAFIFFTTLPQEKEAEALDFMKRRAKNFRQFVMTKKSFGFTPKIDFYIDQGEHNRQKIDELIENEYKN